MEFWVNMTFWFLAMYPPPPQDWKIFLKVDFSKGTLELADVPPPKIQKSSKNEILVFGLYATSDDGLSKPSDESHLKCKKHGCQIIKK